jgi:ParB family chromosome partitioning protein
MQYTMIEVKKLEASPQNARRTLTARGAEELQASILAHGLMQNLVVTRSGDDAYLVIAGGRRLEALRELQAAGKLPADHAVPCQIVADDHAMELSLAENTVRQAMHPADEFEAFARLADQGETAEHIAARFGVTARHVEQRMKLSRVAPELLTAYREGALTLDALMGFTITDDHAKQRQVYEALAPWQLEDASAIRSALTEEMAEASSKLAKFVGLDAYREAGGSIRTDLFGEESYLEHPELLHRLAADKLDTVRRALEDEGWKWVEIAFDRDWSVISGCGRLRKQPVDAPPELLGRKAEAEARLAEIGQALEDTESDALIEALDAAEAALAEIDEQIDTLAAFDPAEVAQAGCYVTIGHDGQLDIEKGLVRREDAKRLASVDSASPKPKSGLPDSLCRDLAVYRLQAAQAEIARHRLIALDLLTFATARSMLGKRRSSGPDVAFQPHLPTARGIVPGETLTAIEAALPLSWLHPMSEAEQFQAFLALSDTEKLDLLAYCVALSLKPQLSTFNADSAFELALSLTDARMERYWRPTQANYLGRITRDRLLSLGSELFGPQWAQARSRDRKGELAAELERAFAEPEKTARGPQQLEALRRWLPDGMAFGACIEPQDASDALLAA